MPALSLLPVRSPRILCAAVQWLAPPLTRNAGPGLGPPGLQGEGDGARRHRAPRAPSRDACCLPKKRGGCQCRPDNAPWAGAPRRRQPGKAVSPSAATAAPARDLLPMRGPSIPCVPTQRPGPPLTGNAGPGSTAPRPSRAGDGFRRPQALSRGGSFFQSQKRRGCRNSGASRTIRAPLALAAPWCCPQGSHPGQT